MAKKEPELLLRPEIKVKRLNRLAILLVAGLGVVVLWVIYFALSTQPSLSGDGEPRQTKSPRIDHSRYIEELERLAAESREQAEPPSTHFERQPVVRRESRRGTQDRRLDAAKEATVLAAGFGSQSRRGPEAAAPMESVVAESPIQETVVREVQPPTSSITATLHQPSATVLPEGTRIPAVLTSTINSDLPGQTSALVRQSVYDQTGERILIPQGSRLLGRYDHETLWGQRRVFVHWTGLLLPDGRRLSFGEALPSADAAGMAGLRDKVNHHTLRTFGGALLLSATSGGLQLSQPQESSAGDAPSAGQVLAGAMGQELGRTATEVVRKNLEVGPTLRIRPGYLFQVVVTGDLALPI